MPRAERSDPILTEVTRSGRLESWHRGSVAVVHGDAPLLLLGDAERAVYARSAVKPFQAMPLLQRGLHRRLGLADGEIAVMAASHDGTPAHVAAVRSLLHKGGIAEDLLGCGPHAPFDAEARAALFAAGGRPQRVHNNCSGKHAGFLILAREAGDDPAAYLDPACRSQAEVGAAVAAMAGVDAPVPVGTDGCGAPTFFLPLLALARAFARLANPAGPAPVASAACQTLLQAVAREPELLSGPRRMCCALIRSLPVAAFPKNGAEGVYCVALAPDPSRPRCPGGVGIAIKIDDGSTRGYEPVVVDLLRELGAFRGAVPDALAEWRAPVVKNTRGVEVGTVRCAADWSAAWQGGAS